MKIKVFLLVLLCVFSMDSVRAFHFDDYDDEAFSPSIPLIWEGDEMEGIHTYGQYKVGDFYYYILDEEKYEVALVAKEPVWETQIGSTLGAHHLSCFDWEKKNYEGDIEVPSSVEIEGKTYSVVMVGYGAFYGSDKLRSVTFPDSVRFISTRVFVDCPNLEQIKLGKGTFISMNLFMVNQAMKILDLSECKASILQLYCEELEVVKMPKFIDYDFMNRIMLSGDTYPHELWFYSKEINFHLEVWGEYLEREDLIIYVPKGCKEMYMESPEFKKFKTKNYIEFDESNASDIKLIENVISAKAEYFDLQGRAVVEPESGIYIRRQGDKAAKVYIR